jgi:hypothetical protein
MFGSEKRKYRNDVITAMVGLAPVVGPDTSEAFKALFKHDLDIPRKEGLTPLSAAIGIGMHFTTVLHKQTMLSDFASIDLLNPYKMWLINLADVIANDPQFNDVVDAAARKELRKEINWLSKRYVSAEEDAKDKPIIYADYLKTGRMLRASVKKNLNLK